jgi:hypothetical protein
MRMKKHLWVVSILLLAALGLAGCKDQDALVDTGNKSLEEGNKQTADAQKQLTDLLNETAHNFHEDRAALKGKVDEVVSAYDKSIASLKNGAEKYEEISKLKIDGKLKDYYSTLAQSYRKMVDQREISKKQAKLVTDESIAEQEEFVSKVNSLAADKDKLQAEVTGLQDKAKKIQADNPGVFTKRS